MGLTQTPNTGLKGRGMRRATVLCVLTAATLTLAFTSVAGASEGFTATGSMAGERDQGVAIRLGSGKVLVLGGERSLVAGLSFPAGAELYDPASGQFAPTGAMSSARWGSPSKAVLLRDGKVLVAGGDAGLGTLASGHGDLYDPESGQFTLTHGSMITPRRYATATLLPDRSMYPQTKKSCVPRGGKIQRRRSHWRGGRPSDRWPASPRKEEHPTPGGA